MTKAEQRKRAVKLTLPVFCGYIVLGIAFGATLAQAGYGPVWALAMGTAQMRSITAHSADNSRFFMKKAPFGFGGLHCSTEWTGLQDAGALGKREGDGQ